MKWTRTVGPLGGVLAGFVLATVLHNYPKDQVTRHRFCQLCAEYEETYREGVILGARQENKSKYGGPVREMLAGAVGEHEHDYTEWATIFPTFGVPEEHPEVARRIRAIREIEESPAAIAALVQALQNDEERATRLIQRLIDPDEGLTLAALQWLDRPGLTWEERWAKIDETIAEEKTDK